MKALFNADAFESEYRDAVERIESGDDDNPHDELAICACGARAYDDQCSICFQPMCDMCHESLCGVCEDH